CKLLSDSEGAILRRLSVFVGGFTFEGAVQVAGSGLKEEEVFDAIGGLFAKSIAAADTSGPVTRYRLLDMTRTFVTMKLEKTGEREAARQMHAVYFRDLMQQAVQSGTDLARDIDNIRAALTFAHEPGNDPAFAVELTALSGRIWLRNALLTECRDWM